MLIQYFEIKQMGRIDAYPVSTEVCEAVKLLAAKFSPVMTPAFIEGLKMLGHTLEKVERPNDK